MSPRRILTMTTRVVRQFVHDRRSLALLFIAPLVVLTILNFVLNDATSGVTLGIVPPAGPIGEQLVAKVRQSAVGQSGLTVTTLAAGDVEDKLKHGDIDGALTFPDDLAQQAQSGTITLQLQLEGSNPSVAKELTNLATLIAQSAIAPAGGPSLNGGIALSVQVNTQYTYGGRDFTATDALAPMLVGLFAFFFVFLLTSVAFLRERSQGTIERLMVSPLRRSEVVLGYVFGFTIFALLQSLLILLFVIGVLRVHYHGNLGLLFLVTLLLTIGGVNMGIFASAFARNELQVVQFIPLLLVPQVLLGGLFFPIKTLPPVLYQLAYVMPLTYANKALQDLMIRGLGFGDIWGDLVFLAGFATVMVALSAFSLRGERI